MAKEKESERGEGEFWDVFNKKAARFLPVAQVAEFFGTEPGYVAVVCIVFLLGFLLFGIGGNLITQLIGFVYPAYESFKAIEHFKSEREDAPVLMRTWLTYWIVYSLFSVIDVFVDYILYWIPLYYLVKLVFLVWLFPRMGGADVIYKIFIEPTLRQYRKRIDTALDDAHSRVKEVGKDLSGVAKQAGRAAQIGLAAASASRPDMKEE
jgi:receptor expression-enhancing protein 5/6